jgi:hypothetical protein
LIFQSTNYEVEIIDEPEINDPSVNYSTRYLLGEVYQNSPQYGIHLKSPRGEHNSCLVLADGGSTSVHEHSAVIHQQNLYIAIGNMLCCFDLPSLNLRWHCKVDDSMCYAVYLTPDGYSLLTHGELTINRVGFTGQVSWHVSGKDIFLEPFTLRSDCIEVVDFNQEKYEIKIDDGRIRVI